MFAVFLPPYPFRGVKAPYLWLFLKYLHCSNEKILFITSPDYVEVINDETQHSRWEFDAASMASLGYSIPDEQSLARHEYLYLDHALYETMLAQHHHDPIKSFTTFLTESISELENELFSLLTKEIIQRVDAFVSICNCPSLEKVARALNKEVIHLEIGPLRAPMYRNTAYLDFTGVNGNTEARARYESCQTEIDITCSMNDLHRYFLEAISLPSSSENQVAGIVLQVEDDSNIIAYSHDFTNISLISYVRQQHSLENILVRAHPGSLFRLRDDIFSIDASANSLEFIQKCHSIYTINSSVGLEALLCEKKTNILGDCSYAFVAEEASGPTRVNAMAFYLFAYLVPFELIFNLEYLRFRLDHPAELDIVRKHLQFYSKMPDEREENSHTLSTLINEAISKDITMRTILENSLAQNNKQLEDLKTQLAAEVTEREKLAAAITKLQQTADLAAKDRDILVSALAVKQDEVDRMRRSLSWKLTMPVRMSGRISRGEFSTIKAMMREYTNSGNNVFSRYILSGGLLSKSKYKTAIRLLLSGNWSGMVDGFKRVLSRAAIDSSPATPFVDTGTVRILATQHTLFVAHLIEKNLLDCGIKGHVSTAYSVEQDMGQMHIVVCPQMFKQLPRNYIAFQMEQSVNSRWFTDEYFSRLNNAVAIFDYSLKNIEYLLDKGIPYQKLFYMPISSFPDYPAHLADNGYVLDDQKGDIHADVLFYGDPNCERRKAYLQELKKHFNVTLASEVFGDKLTRMVKNAKVVVNIHYYENALLETTRLYETISLGTPVVSESSSDIVEHEDLQDVIDFCPIGDIPAMVEKIQNLLSDKEYYNERKEKIKHFTNVDNKNNYYLRRYLLSIDKLNFSQYKSIFSFEQFQTGDVPRLCLSLSETPVRRKAFFASPSHGFQFFEGIRYRIGWIGCGMSYKYMLSGMLASKAEMGIICEDDVIFPVDYDNKLNKIINHLQSTEAKWHIFAGIIAHLHEDTKVLDVKVIDGIEYIYIDKMTSMVMNIYSRRGMDLISQWDEKNIDAETNTIDRYVESAQDLVVVTTLPFLVGYAEEQQSTLWGFENSQYTSLIKASEKLLAEKVAEFKKNR
ncbi:GT99 family glycosyltransferase N-terminal domain-containing protein [Klebsiella pneumoniae complex sp. WS1778]|uniref:GT99 family glycosyltransferase N-terminal domain-containing protein n=1 Tax=Klebsiella pneumoniae complex sp. WS1778 TaxID=3390277 RepID=UPI003C0DE007